MSEEQLKAFLEKVKGDTSLQEKLKGAADVDAVIAIAKSAGFVVFADEIKTAQATQELSDEEIEGVAGGFGACEFGADSQGFTGTNVVDTKGLGGLWGCPD